MWRRSPGRPLAAAALAVLTVGVTAVPALAAPRDQQWYLDQINVTRAQQTTRGDGVTIGLLTNGLPVDHPDLAGRILPTMRVDHGLWDSVEEAPADYPLPDTTATAQIGLMTARGGGGGLLGVAPAARVRPMICPGLAEDTDRCLRWLVDSGVDVIDFSQAQFDRLGPDFGGIRYALAKDVVVVMALRDGARLSPRQRAGVVLVGGVDRDGALPPSAQPDDRVSLRAPGPDPVGAADNQVIGLDPAARDGSGYGRLSTTDGDRIAAALVTGVAALIRSKYPRMTAPSVINRLVRTAVDRGAPGRDNSYGYGVVDADAALTSSTPDVTANPLGAPDPPASPGVDGRYVALTVGAAVAVLLVLIVVVGLLVWRRRGR